MTDDEAIALALAEAQSAAARGEVPVGAVLHGPRFFEQRTCHHRPEIARAGDAAAASEMLRDFFRARR